MDVINDDSNGLEMCANIPPAVTRVAINDKAAEAPFETARKERNGKAMTTQKHHSGTPFLVVYLRNFGARPSRLRP